MNKTKKEKLRKSGWRVGTAADFLALSEQEAALIEIKLALARDLKIRRQSRKLTQAELARLLRSSQSRVAKMEAGDPAVSLDLLLRSLLSLGASTKQLARIFSSLRTA
ncbi:MAG TPA: helix-turn-helix domain-containing protein [Candidatus Krumholzibacteria bacterium]|nr:helix-turn-helix domain-containing protein [Candidatus Krumholzibacteria bacterium]